jgi:hypothetical protein
LVLHSYLLGDPLMSVQMMRQLTATVLDSSWLPGGDQVPSPLLYHAAISLRYGCGLTVAVLTPVAIVAGLWAGGSSRLIAVLAVGLLAPLGASTMVLARYLLPAFPAIAVLAALLVIRLVRWVPGTTGKALTALCAIGLLAAPLCDSMAMVTTLAREDTRTLAGQWLSANVPPGSQIVVWGAPGVVDFGSPPLVGFDRISGLPPERWAERGVRWLVHHEYPLPYSSRPLPSLPSGWRLAADFTPFEAGAKVAPVLEPLDAFYLPLARFNGIERPGPRIRIYRRLED